MANQSVYPVSVEGELSEDLSRWLWLVKWILIIPHLVVLFFLWITFIALTVVAFFAIVFTGKYPRGMFAFNVGVMRWTWRVGFYSYSALGTDKYPPFSLESRDYPANLEVEYPESLSRGLVFVKSWLLAIPHYIVMAFLSGGAGSSSVGSLKGLLVIFAAIVLLFRGRYPQDIYNLIIGFNRWSFRVLAYAALMRDDYPPFRLSQ